MGICCKPIQSADSMGMRLLLETCGFAGFLAKPFDFRGLNRFCKIAGRTSHGSAIVKFHPDVMLRVHSSDPYWLSVASRARRYEAEVESVLERFRHEPMTFIDGGANVGYWSIFAAKRFGWRVAAIEAGRATFKRLSENVALNQVNVTLLHNAVSDVGSRQVSFVTVSGHHAGAHIADVPAEGVGVEAVVTISVDELAATHHLTDAIILKLDVEGYELPALKGARRVLQGRALAIYEEHGSRRSCEPTQMLLADGFDVFFMEADSLVPVRSVADVAARMSNEHRGYNLLATRSKAMTERLLSR